MTDLENYSTWVGREDELASDIVTKRSVSSFIATFGEHLASYEDVPIGMHWCLTPTMLSSELLGPDGHPAKGGFLPPIQLPRRMWASSSLEFFRPIKLMENVEKRSTIENVSWKNGKTGLLCFVTVRHDYNSAGELAIREDQNIVYREAASVPLIVSNASPCEKVFNQQWHVTIDNVMLFRYSAITFNGHRIHYDLPYAKNEEFYSNLVIHGPLQATLLLNLATAFGKSPPKQFSFRGVSPATGQQTLTVGVQETSEGCDLSIVAENGIETMTGTAKW